MIKSKDINKVISDSLLLDRVLCIPVCHLVQVLTCGGDMFSAEGSEFVVKSVHLGSTTE